MKWYCWKILLQPLPGKEVHEMSFVTDDKVSRMIAINRARVGLMHYLNDMRGWSSKIIQIERVGPFATIEEAAKEKEISLVS